MSDTQPIKPRSLLAGYLQRAGITQQQFARQVGISPQHLSEILSGKKFPSYQVAIRISRAAGVPIELLLTEGAA